MASPEESILKRVLPHSVEAEQSVIGSMIMDRDAILTASEIITGDDFYNKQYGVIYDTMVELYNAGKIRAIGISNFRQHHIDELMKTATIPPMADQIRLCPGDTQDGLVAYCRERGILLEAYSPLGSGKIFAVPEMKEIAEKYGKSIAQICVRWSLQNGFLPLPKSVTPDRIRENLDVFGFQISDEDMKTIAGLTGCAGLSSDPDKTNW